MAHRSRVVPDPLKPALLAALRAQLAQGERLAWAASPDAATDEPTTRGSGRWEAVAILGGGYATLGACVMAVRSGHWLWLSVPIALLVFGLVGYFAAAWIKARADKAVEGTVYGLTTRRALVVRTYPAPTVQALPIDAISDVAIVDEHGDVADLSLHAASGSAGLLFRRVIGPKRARTQLLRVIRDPMATDRQIAASEAYIQQMRQLMVRSARD